MDELISAAHYLKKLLSSADDVVISAEHALNSQTKFANSKVITNQQISSSSLQVFAAFNKRCISTSVKDISRGNLQKVADHIKLFSRSIQPNSEYAGIAKGPFKYSKPGNYDRSLETFDPADSVRAALSSVPSGCRAAGVLETSKTKGYLTTSGGVEAEERETKLYFSLRVIASEDASAQDVHCSCTLKGFAPDRITRDCAQIALGGLKPKSLAAGQYDVVFEPLPAANLLEHLGRSASAFAVDAGFSFLAGKLGKKVASSELTVWDDPTLPDGINSARFDDEGVPARRNTILDKGILTTYLHNTSTAKKAGVKTTANAGLISPEPYELVVKEGKLNKAELIKNVKRGLLVTNVWYTRFQNYTTGAFSTIPRDVIFQIRNGRIIGAVKGIRVSDVLPRMLQTASPAKGSKQVAGWEVELPVVTPAVLMRKVRITRSTDDMLEAD